jgi:ribosomal protein S18 acetylase RimI-like enzyme
MLTYEPVTGAHYDDFLQLLLAEAGDYLPRTLELMGLTLEQAEELFRKTGQVYAIHEEDALAGYYWIEERGDVLHLHGLVLKGEFQGRGIGTHALAMLADRYASRMEAIELGVHASNARAKGLYERPGFQTVKHLEELGFSIMQLSLREQTFPQNQ